MRCSVYNSDSRTFFQVGGGLLAEVVGLKRLLLVSQNFSIKSGGRGGGIKTPQPPGSAVLIKTTHNKSGVEFEEEPELLFLVNILPSIHSATHLKESYFKDLNPAKCCKNTN